MVLRVMLVTGVAVSLMSAVANGSFLGRLGVTAGCSSVRATGSLLLESCHAGWFKGYPNLSAKGCTSTGITGRTQYWSCPAS